MLDYRKDYHMHTTFSDGHHSAEEMVRSAIDKNLLEIGFSDHSYTSFETRYCMQLENYQKYKETILYLKSKYQNAISIKLGIEQDYYSKVKLENVDYTIGACHFIFFKDENEYVCIDSKPYKIINAANKYFNGDIYGPIEMYFQNMANLKNITNCDIVAHFDIVCKSNEVTPFFDEHHPRYVKAWHDAADQLLGEKVLFEVNTGAIARQWKAKPYPSSEIVSYLREHDAQFVFGSDSHDVSTIAFDFEKYRNFVD